MRFQYSFDLRKFSMSIASGHSAHSILGWQVARSCYPYSPWKSVASLFWILWIRPRDRALVPVVTFTKEWL